MRMFLEIYCDFDKKYICSALRKQVERFRRELVKAGADVFTSRGELAKLVGVRTFDGV